MRRESHVRFCESPGGKFPRATRLIMTARTPEQLKDKIIPAVSAFLAERGLELSPEKSKVSDVNTGFDFLGVTIRKYSGKLLMKPAR